MSRKLVGLALMVTGVALCLWHCRFGVDLTDEAAYLLPGFKLLGLGDKPFIDEIFLGPKNFSFANYFLVRPFLPYSVYGYRIAAVLFYAFVLALAVRKSFASRFGMIAGLAFFICLTFDVFVMPTWSHNSWVRVLLIAYLVVFPNPKSEKNSRAFFLSGLLAGAMATIYQPLVVVTLFSFAVVGFLRVGTRSRFQTSPERPVVSYAAGMLLVPLLYIFTLYRWGVLGEWLPSVRLTAALSSYRGNTTFQKLLDSIWYVVRTREFWLVLFTAPVASILSNRRNSPRIVKLLSWVIVAFATFFVGRRLLLSSPPAFMMSQAFIGLGFAGGIAILFSLNRESEIQRMPILFALAASIVMGLSSMTGTTAFSWAMPALIVPFLGRHCKMAVPIDRGPLFSRRREGEWGRVAALMPITLLLLFIGVGAFRYQLTHSYFDVAPDFATAKVNSPPLQGLKTSARRAFIVDKMAQAVQGKQFILPYPPLPGSLLFAQVRSSRDTTFEIEDYIPDEIRRSSLLKIASSARKPELLILVKRHPWSWGRPENELEFPPTLTFSPRDRFLGFIQCAKDRTIEDFPEFAVFSVNAGRVDTCARENADILLGQN